LAPHNQYQSFVVFDYVSKYAPHKQRMLTRQFSNSGFTDAGTFENWSGGSIAGDTMCDAWAAQMQQLVPSTTVIAGYTIYKKSTPDDLGVPAYSKSLSLSGLSTVDGWEEAVQQQFMFRTTGYNLAKVVLLDVRSANLFGRYTTIAGDYLDMATMFMNPDNAWAGRDGLQPAVFKLTTTNINEKLRREYHIT